jgi:hypothetical protein
VTTGFCRQLVVFVDAAQGSDKAELFDQLVDFLGKNQELKLHKMADLTGAEQKPQGEQRVVYFEQGNAKVSRKVLEPILAQQFFACL